MKYTTYGFLFAILIGALSQCAYAGEHRAARLAAHQEGLVLGTISPSGTIPHAAGFSADFATGIARTLSMGSLRRTAVSLFTTQVIRLVSRVVPRAQA